MNLYKTSFYSGIAVVIRMATLLGLNKVLAIFVGPAGYALVGQFQNAVTIVTAFSSGAVNNGIIKYTADYANDKEQLFALWRTAFLLCLISVAVFSLGIGFFSTDLSLLILKQTQYSYVFKIFSLTLFLFVINTILLAILNGLREIKSLVIANIFGSLLSLLLTTLLTSKYGLSGALTSLAINQSVALIATFFICFKKKWFKLKCIVGYIDLTIAANLMKFAAMALVSTVLTPVVLIFIRWILSSNINIEAAGYWESLNRLSGAYLTFFTTTLSVYLLPKLSSLKTARDIKNEILDFYKILIPVLILISITLFVLKEEVVTLLFSREFIPITKVIGWQLLGDFFKMLSWVLSYVMLSKAMVKLYIITEISFQLVYLISTWCLLHFLRLESVTISYFITYLGYFLVLYYFVFINLESALKTRGDDVV